MVITVKSKYNLRLPWFTMVAVADHLICHCRQRSCTPALTPYIFWLTLSPSKYMLLLSLVFKKYADTCAILRVISQPLWDPGFIVFSWSNYTNWQITLTLFLLGFSLFSATCSSFHSPENSFRAHTSVTSVTFLAIYTAVWTVQKEQSKSECSLGLEVKK